MIMKKKWLIRLILLLLTWFVNGHITAQFTATGVYKSYYKKYIGIDYLFVFNGINTSTAIVYNGTGYGSIKWYKFDNQTTPIVLQNANENYNIEDATGYVVDIDGVKTTIWVLDYQKYLPQFGNLTVSALQPSECSQLLLTLQATVPEMSYKTTSGVTRKINRFFELSYHTMEWTNAKWTDKTITSEVILPSSQIVVNESPLKDTRFTLKGDQFAADLNLEATQIVSSTYSAVRTECHILSVATVRSELNEAERPDKPEVTVASGPLEMLFSGNANSPVSEFSYWEVFKDNSLLVTRTDDNLRYNFEESGTYKIRLRVSNRFCSFTDSLVVQIVTSQIQVPPAFTPNGDGKNDEFRVAYKSIGEFRCWIFNRWQQQVFYFDNPQNGWDGRIDGKPATTGTYYYVIEAVGTDGVKHARKGHFSLLRGVKE